MAIYTGGGLVRHQLQMHLNIVGRPVFSPVYSLEDQFVFCPFAKEFDRIVQMLDGILGYYGHRRQVPQFLHGVSQVCSGTMIDLQERSVLASIT